MNEFDTVLLLLPIEELRKFGMNFSETSNIFMFQSNILFHKVMDIASLNSQVTAKSTKNYPVKSKDTDSLNCGQIVWKGETRH
ncbi:hypothetical protein ACTXT7_012181 [Hymenolepis weldensis]